MNLAEFLVNTAEKFPTRKALFKGAECCATYKIFLDRVVSLAFYLNKIKGIKKYDRVAIFMANATEYLEIMYAVWYFGAVVVPINSKLHRDEAIWIINNSGAKVVFTDNKKQFDSKTDKKFDALVISILGSKFKELYSYDSIDKPVKIKSDDLVWLFYTSGTTGKPKGVMLSSRNLRAMIKGYIPDVDSVYPVDTALYAAPMSHGAGLYNIIFVKFGARHSVPTSGKFEPSEIIKLAPKLTNVCMFLAPTMVNRLVKIAIKGNYKGKGIKTIVYGGGPMYLGDILKAGQVMGSKFVQIFGQGECPMAISVLKREEVIYRENDEWCERVTSVGRKQRVVDVVIKDHNGVNLPVNQIGEIWVSGAPVMIGYWKNLQATKNTIIDGWLRTGDLGRVNGDGFIILEGRSKDLIISGGSNIYPKEVEDVLLQYPGVSEASVVGKMDAEWGEIVIAFIVGPNVSISRLDEFCLEKMARFKRPKKYIFLETLPKNNYGKILKTDLRKLL